MKCYRFLIPSLVLAFGTVIATAVAVVTTGPGWIVMAGPAVLALAILASGLVDRRLLGRSWACVAVAGAVGVVFAGACAIVAVRDASLVSSIVPILGGGAVVVLARPRRCGAAPIARQRGAA